VWWAKRECKKIQKILIIKTLRKIKTSKILEIVVRLRIISKLNKKKRKTQLKSNTNTRKNP
jgi:hypothetical protein